VAAAAAAAAGGDDTGAGGGEVMAAKVLWCKEQGYHIVKLKESFTHL